MLFSIILGIIAILILTAFIFDDIKEVKSDTGTSSIVGHITVSMITTLILTAVIGVILGFIMLVLSLTFMFPSSDNDKSSTVREELYSVDAETLNGREFFVINDNNQTLYITHDKNGATQAITVNTEDVTIYEDEEAEPYVSYRKNIPQEQDYTWYLPFFKPIIGSETTTDTELHVPLKSIKYYVNETIEVDQ